MNLGALWIRLENFDAAETALASAVRSAPRQAPARLSLAQLYLHTNRKLPEAVDHAKTAVELAPTAAGYAVLAMAQQRNGDLQSAQSAIDRALELEPENAQFRAISFQIRQPQ